MSKRPLCQVLVVLIVLIGVFKYLGISWLWKSPAGTLPLEWAAKEQCAEVTGIVFEQEEKTYQNKTYTYLYLKQINLSIESEDYPIRKIKCTLEGQAEDFLGCQITLTGVLSLPEKAKNPGEFDQNIWESSQKIDFYLTDISYLEQCGEAKGLERITSQIKKKGKEILFEIFPEEEAGILEAMIFGEKSSLDTETKNQFQAAGISHIIAISGLHMSLIGMGIWTACKWIGLPMWLAVTSSVGILLGYGMLLGNPTTAFRALLMFGIMMSAKILGRSYDLLSALAAAGILLLLDNPDILENSGFQLSFSAVFGMGCYCNLEEEIFQEMWSEKGKWWNSLRSGLSLWFFSLPVVLYSFYQVSVLGILINLFVIPLMPVVLGSGLLALLLGLWGAGPGSIAGIPAYFLLKGYEILGDVAQNCPFGVWTPGKPEVWQLIFYYVVLFGMAYGMKYLIQRKNSEQEEKNTSVQKSKRMVTRSKIRRRKLWLAIQIGTKLFLLLLISAPWNKLDKVTVLDVGQGDGIVLQSDGKSILVDGGSSSRKKIGNYVLLPYLKYEGIAYLDMILVTHSDEDHMNGALEVLEESQKGWFQVGAVGMPYWMRQSEGGMEIENLAELSGTEVVYLKKGDQITFGNVQIRILYPGEEDFSEDTNAGSLVFVLETGEGNGLFTGDLPLEAETDILGVLEPCSFLKVAHHGSNGSTSSFLLEKTNPQFALISCGENNRYGHPGTELMGRLEENSCEIYRTDLQGAVTINLRTGEIETFTCP